MSAVLHPVWPWSRLWEILQQLPGVLLAVAAVAAAAAVLLPVLLAARRVRGARLGVASVLLLSVGLLARNTWPFALADGRQLAGSGVSGFAVGLLVQLALVVLLLGPFALAGISIAVYVGLGLGAPRRRLLVAVSLRLLAFALALLAVARPALAWPDRQNGRSLLYVVLDHSRSMATRDEQAGRSRWELLLRSLKESAAALDRLRDEHQTDVRFFRFAGGVSPFDPDAPGEPDGKQTDFGTMLRDVLEGREPGLRMRAVVVVSDGADNGVAVPAVAEAARLRGVPCPLHTFGCGSPNTPSDHNDVSITSISTSPAPFVPVKGKLTTKVTIDARGFENSKARVRLFLEDLRTKVDREVTAQDVRLPLSVGNEVRLVCDAPAEPGEVKVKVVVEPADRDALPLNNAIETFVTVSKEGISVLLVDKGGRAFEPQFLYDALAQDQRIRVTPVWVRGKGRAGPGGKTLFGWEQPYDVILLGDVTARELTDLDPEALNQIEKLVGGKGAGLMMLGGYSTFGNGDWKDTPLERMLPVDLSVKGQDEEPVQMVPTPDGLRRFPYVLRLDGEPDLQAAWKRLAKLEGRTVLQLRNPPGPTDQVLATTRPDEGEKTGEPLLVMRLYAGQDLKGQKTGAVARVLAFGGDTTFRWRRSEEGARLHARFWKQVVVWLAKQEDAAGSIYVRPDVRRLPVRNDLGFQVGLRGKGGGPDLAGGTFEVDVTDPSGKKTRVSVVRGATETRGVFGATQAPGVYTVTVRGHGKDPSGGEVSGQASARVIVYDQDLETMHPAADPEFLKRLAAAGGGEALRVEQLPNFLNRLAERAADQGRPKLRLRPDWRSTAPSGFLVAFFLAFCVVVCAEWGLRRWWGMV
jgi:uncharacterized membrane protein